MAPAIARLLPLTLPSLLPFSSGSAVQRLTTLTQESLAFNATAGQAGALQGEAYE